MLLFCFRIYASTNCDYRARISICKAHRRWYENHIKLMRLSRAFLFLRVQTFFSVRCYAATGAEWSTSLVKYSCTLHVIAVMNAVRGNAISTKGICARWMVSEWSLCFAEIVCLHYYVGIGQVGGKIKFKICCTVCRMCSTASSHMLHVLTDRLLLFIISILHKTPDDAVPSRCQSSTNWGN